MLSPSIVNKFEKLSTNATPHQTNQTHYYTRSAYPFFLTQLDLNLHLSKTPRLATIQLQQTPRLPTSQLQQTQTIKSYEKRKVKCLRLIKVLVNHNAKQSLHLEEQDGLKQSKKKGLVVRTLGQAPFSASKLGERSGSPFVDYLYEKQRMTPQKHLGPYTEHNEEVLERGL